MLNSDDQPQDTGDGHGNSSQLKAPNALKLVDSRVGIKQTPQDIQAKSEKPGTAAVERKQRSLTDVILDKLEIVKGQTGSAYAVFNQYGNKVAIPVGSKQLDHIILTEGRHQGRTPRKKDIAEVREALTLEAESQASYQNVWYRIAPVDGGIEIDLGDPRDTRVRVTPGKVEILEKGSNALFFRTPVAQAMVRPAEQGHLKLLDQYLNLEPSDRILLTAWLSYTLAHPKVDTSKYVMLVLQGDQGTGKTSLCNNILLPLLDPNRVGVQGFPRNDKDFAIAAQNAHVLCFDNMREVKRDLSDLLCRASSGGSLTGRALYSDDSLHVHNIQVAMVLNGIHSFIDQPDLADRCLMLNTLAINGQDRRPESEIVQSFQADLPQIFRGLLDLIAEVYRHLPEVVVASPERMIDFVRWLAAMERVHGVAPGTYQSAYSETLEEGRLEGLMESPLASAMIKFMDMPMNRRWTGTPTALLERLGPLAPQGGKQSNQWPRNPITLSKRLKTLQANLHGQGIDIEFGRGKERQITLTSLKDF